MAISVRSAINNAMDTILLNVESSFVRGFSGIQLIGNASDICRDGKERARTALECLGYMIPPKRIIVSLTPGDLRKDGNHLDLPIAVSLALLIRDHPPFLQTERWLFAAEISLNGLLKPVRGVIPFTIQAMLSSLEGIVIAHENLKEVEALVPLAPNLGQNLKIIACATMNEVLDWIFEGKEPRNEFQRCPPLPAIEMVNDFDDMHLLPPLKEVAMAVAAGGHSLLLQGAPGTGKSMFAARLPSLLEKMPENDHLECLKIHSLSEHNLDQKLIDGAPPFRSPHHQASSASLLGTSTKPGELSRAHGGILFLDELPEFRRDFLEALREPLETGEIQITRVHGSACWKSRIILICSANPCPCGWLGSELRPCHCPIPKILSYSQKLSGPILDRIDIRISMPQPEPMNATGLAMILKRAHNQTHALKKRIQVARSSALERNQRFGVTLNRDINAQDLPEACDVRLETLAGWVSDYSAAGTQRSIVRALRVARTLADLAGRTQVCQEDVIQAWSWQKIHSTPEALLSGGR